MGGSDHASPVQGTLVKTISENQTLGIGLRVLSGFLFAAMSICIKATSGQVPVGQIVFFRSAFALIPLVIFL